MGEEKQTLMRNSIFIPGNVPSLKNNKRIVTRGKFPLLLPSKRVVAWNDETAQHWERNRKRFHDMWCGTFPVHVVFLFVRGSKHKFDYTNALDTVQDAMVAHKWIPDDNADILIPIIEPYVYNKSEPGVLIKVF